MIRDTRMVRNLASVVALAWSAWGCSGSATSPNTFSVAGTWTGTASDRLGPAVLTWTLRQTGHDVSGTATMRPVNATDGSCASCHKSKDGTLEGVISGTSFTLSMFFAAGNTA